MSDPQREGRLERLEEQVNRRVHEALAGLREQVRERLRRAQDEVLGDLDEVGPELPESFLPHDELASLSDETASERRLAGELLAAIAAIDASRGQGELLETLARESGRFAGRTAVLVTRPRTAELWASHGWGEGRADELALDYPEDGAWSPDRFGRGTVPLETADCGILCSRLEAPLPDDGVLVPLVLRDRVAAVLYADRPVRDAADEAAAALHTEALQALVYTAALALESLPFRERRGTASLTRADAAGELGEPLPLWGAEGSVEAAPEPAPAAFEGETETADELRGEEAATTAPEPTEAAVAGFALESEEVSEEPVAAAPFGELEGGEPADGGAEPEPESAAEAETEADETAAGEPVLEDEQAPPAWSAPSEEEVEIEPSPQDEEDYEASPAGEPADLGATVAMPRGGFGTTLEEPPPPPVEEAPDEPSAAVEEEPAAAPQAAESTAEPTAEPSEQEQGEATVGGPRSSEVLPPSDLQGPGRAFAAGAQPGDEPRHEEARRLARLLVSEILLYNEEEVEAGRRTGDVYERLKDDIDRSRQIYEERVDPSVVQHTDYFYQELVRILARGDAKALGI